MRELSSSEISFFKVFQHADQPCLMDRPKHLTDHRTHAQAMLRTLLVVLDHHPDCYHSELVRDWVPAGLNWETPALAMLVLPLVMKCHHSDRYRFGVADCWGPSSLRHSKPAKDRQMVVQTQKTSLARFMPASQLWNLFRFFSKHWLLSKICLRTTPSSSNAEPLSSPAWGRALQEKSFSDFSIICTVGTVDENRFASLPHVLVMRWNW